MDSALGELMTRTIQNRNWPQQAQAAGWSLPVIAQNAGVSVRTLERYFQRQMGQCPESWLNAERMRQAEKLLADGFFVKEVAARLGYKTSQHFSRVFKQRYGHPPSRAR